MPEFTNALINETSPYLLQHAHNPVNWQAWNDVALDQAKLANKLIIVSVGYAACHWCHVMEHESFEDEEVATIMNEHYISIKVDREERPDVDQVYMDAAQLLTGRGGWPLNVITLPDGRPIYAGTYFTKEQWLKVLKGVQAFYTKTPEKAKEQAMQVAAGVTKMNYVPFNKTSEFSMETLHEAASDWLNALDQREGGRAGQMKFPMPGAYLALLRYGASFDDQRTIDLLRLTLDKMASGGLYDQLGGGFSRYSVDPYWHVPHFEKMLYDNAQLITLYSEAYKFFKDPFYLQIVDETITFCLRELRSSDGGFMSSIDADSEGEEGQFYVWTAQEIDQVLGKEAALFKSFYGVTKEGNWEDGKNVLKMSRSVPDLTIEFDLEAEELAQQLKASRLKLFTRREKRVRPGTDDKILTSWNALMVTGLTHAYEASGNEQYKELAIDTAQFILNKLMPENRLYRSYKKDKVKINAFLEDYTFLISSFVRLYSISFDKTWITHADKLLKTVLAEYQQPGTDFFNFKSSSDKELFVRKQVLEDNVIPAGNSEIARNLFLIGTLNENHQYLELAKTLTLKLEQRVKEHAAFYYNWFDLYAMQCAKFLEIAITGKEWQKRRLEIAAQFIPYSLYLGGEEENFALLQEKCNPGETAIYICLEKSCLAPVVSISEEELKELYTA